MPRYTAIACRDADTMNALLPKGAWPPGIKLRIERDGRTLGWSVVLDTQMQGEPRFGDLRVGSVIDCLAAPDDAEAVAGASLRFLRARGVDAVISNQSHPAWIEGFGAHGFEAIADRRVFAASPALQAALAPFGEAQHFSPNMTATARWSVKVKSPRQAIFFVVGTRSGTSLLSLMLRNHPTIAYPGEFEFAVDFMPGPDAHPPLDAYADWLSMDRHYRHHRPRIDPALSYPALVRSFLAQMKHEQAPDKPLVGTSVHRHFDRLLHLFPGARYVHLVRDPRDVARSWIDFGWEGSGWAAGRA
jgi:hypothetical protein